MRILNCFKTTPDFDAVPETDWVSGASSGVFDFSYIKQDIDPYSESGLELVLRAKDAFLKESPTDGAAPAIETAALTFGPAVSEKALRTLAALGYDECVRIDGTPDPFQAEQTAAKIAAYCQAHEPFDLIVLGAQSPDGGNKKTPYLLAEYLGMPLLQQVTGFSISGAAGEGATTDRSSRLTVCHTAFGQTIEETVDLPLVLVIGDVPGTLLRVPTLRQRKEASGKEITVIAPEELNDLSVETDEEAAASRKTAADSLLPAITCTGMAPVDSSRQGTRIEGKDAAETAKFLYDNYLREVMEVRR